MKIKNLVTVVTGASQGLGRAIAREFVKEGAHVGLCARDEKLIHAVADDLTMLKSAGQQIFAAPCDVSVEDDVEQFFEAVGSRLGPVNVLINNAGVYGPKGESEKVDFLEWARAIEINLYGTFLPCRCAIREMKGLRRGKIINLSGGGATAPLPRLSAYAASKAAVVRLTETLAEELREFSIDVNAIAPGALNTRLLEEILSAGPDAVGEEFYQKSLKQRESGGVPLEKAARLCIYLASEMSDGISGKLISAQWDPWENLHAFREQLANTDIYTLRRIVPEDRGKEFGT
ncbi:MAG TPA: SDR family oxidoreductase [Chthoniobacterales bacterium]|nr:SDR family oxidoreductase [Chthoniobacterales bacterium]